MDRHFILFVGDNRTGKTTCSRILQDLIRLGYKKDTVVLTFADPLRQELIDFYGIPNDIVFNKSIDKDTYMLRLGEYKYDSSIPELWAKFGLIENISQYENLEISLRQLLISHGTDIRRKENQHYWVESFNRQVEKYSYSEYVICDDTRFESEFEYFKDKSLLIFHLVNGQEVNYDKAQQAFRDWLVLNEEKVIKIEVPIPLLKYTADKIIRANVIPKLLGLRKSH